MFQNFVRSLVVIIESELKPTGLFRVPCWIKGPHGLRFKIFQKSTGNTGRFQRPPLFSSRDRMFQMSVHGMCQQCDHSRQGLLVCCLRKLSTGWAPPVPVSSGLSWGCWVQAESAALCAERNLWKVSEKYSLCDFEQERGREREGTKKKGRRVKGQKQAGYWRRSQEMQTGVV